MTSKFNVIINPVKRWFSQDKEIIDNSPLNMQPFFMKDHQGNDVMCWLGTETYEMQGEEEMTPEQFVYWLSGLLT